MSAKVTIDRETLEVLKSAAWLWSCEPAASGKGEIKSACKDAQLAIDRSYREVELQLDALGRIS